MKSKFSHQKNQSVNCACPGECICGTKDVVIKSQYSRGLGETASQKFLDDDFGDYTY